MNLVQVLKPFHVLLKSWVPFSITFKFMHSGIHVKGVYWHDG